ncbi:response regulator [Flavobacterium sp. Sd200]|uniref:response regulator transcription factor n=1 Tax=Flavobacterium sp. Sd200 TaxID=2692211 RepID=UPI00136F4857|nr:response regulator transcription factor [Flavobacterium sp. Sd200]MXN90788.1 response regulator [Flavobacterium sp. Sd200]
MMPVRIILADDEHLFRSGISFILQREQDINVVFEASDGQEVIDYIRKNPDSADIVIMDLKMPGLNGVEATKVIYDEFPELKIIALTSYDTKLFIANMINIGAAAYLVKTTTPQDLLFTIRQVAAKGFYYSETVLGTIKENIGVIKESKFSFESEDLTNREREIIRLICLQYNTKEIADMLFINYRTVEGHRNNLMLKTQSRNMAGLVLYSLKKDIITLNDLMK